MAKKSQTQTQAQKQAALQSRAQALNLDWAMIQQLLALYGPFVLDMILKLLERLKPQQASLKAAGGKGCCVPEDVAEAMTRAHEAACEACCTSCEACCLAGIEHDDTCDP